jgi:hypothetical protein
MGVQIRTTTPARTNFDLCDPNSDSEEYVEIQQQHDSDESVLNELAYFRSLFSIVFATTATSCESECTFSDSGNLITDKRTALGDDVVEELKMLKRNQFPSVSVSQEKV